MQQETPAGSPRRSCSTSVSRRRPATQAPLNDLAGWMQPIADANPVGAAAAVIRSPAAGGPLAAPLIELGIWLAALILIPGTRAARRWNSPR